MITRNMMKKSLATVLFAGFVALAAIPAAVFAHGGHGGGHGGGHFHGGGAHFARGGGHFGGGEHFARGGGHFGGGEHFARGGGHFGGGEHFAGREHFGGGHYQGGNHYRGGNHYGGRGYYGGGGYRGHYHPGLAVAAGIAIGTSLSYRPTGCTVDWVDGVEYCHDPYNWYRVDGNSYEVVERP